MDSPRTVITDTNIWIDLHRGGITTEVFKLGLLFKTPDLVANEILSPSIASLKRHGLDIIELPGEKVLELLQMARKYSRPSRPDLSTLVLARTENAILLTGDKALRAAGEEEGIEVRGILWLLDEMVKSNVLTSSKAIAALEKMLKEGSRLPKTDCDRYIQRWQKTSK